MKMLVLGERGSRSPSGDQFNPGVAAAERQRSRSTASTLKTTIFVKVSYDLCRFTTTGENAGGPRFVGAAVATERDPPPKSDFHESPN